MLDLQAILVITLLTWAAVSVSGTTTELSKITGDTVSIPCLFGEGTLRNIFWYYDGGTGPQKILFLTKGDLTRESEYADRASLQNDNSTLILKDITVYDEGTYRCDVDRQEQTPVLNITTKLNVFSLRPDTLPVISPCTWVDESSSCSIHANQSFTLTCTLPNVYPVKDTELIWYQDGKRISSTHDVMKNDDGTNDISRQIQVSETGNFTCNATYLTANGRENTVVSVEAWIIPPADFLTNLAPIIVPIVVVIAVVVGVVMFLLLRRRRNHSVQAKGQYGQVGNIELGDKNQGGIEDETLVNLGGALVDESDLSTLGRNLGIRQFKLNQVSKENERATNAFGTNSILFVWKEKTPAAKQIPMMVKALEESGFENLITEHFPNEAGVPDEKIAALAENLKDEDAIEQLGINFGFRQFKVNQYLKSNKDHGDHSGTVAMLQAWRKKTPRTRQIPNLVEALKNAGIDGSFNNN